MPEDLRGFNLTTISTADRETLTISTGDITPVRQFAIVAAETDTADNLDGIVTSGILSPGDADGATIYLMADAGDTITIRHNQNAAATKNILTPTGADIVISDNIIITLVYNIALDTNGAWFVQVPPAAAIGLPIIGTPTYTHVGDLQTVFHSSGWISPGGVISDAGGATINVTAGDGMLRASDSPIAQLKFIEWPASNGLAITANSIRYIGVELNDPNDPQVVVRTSNNFNFNTDFPLGTVVNEAGTLHIQNAPWEVGDHASAMIQRSRGTSPIARDKQVGGLIFSETGTRNIIVTTGALWRGLTSFTIGALNTDPGGAADTFDTYSAGGQEATGVAAWPNGQYDNSGTLTNLDNNKWTNLWWWIELDGDLVMVYGTNQYNTEAQAENEDIPSTLPQRLQVHGILAARFIFQKSAGTASQILSTFVTPFTPSGVTNHDDLGGVSVDQHHTEAHDHIRMFALQLFPTATDCATGNGKSFFHITSELNGMDLVSVRAAVFEAGTTGTMTVMVRNKTDGADMLSTILTFGTPSIIVDDGNAMVGAADDVVTDDIIQIDVDTVHTTAAKGLIVTLGFQLP